MSWLMAGACFARTQTNTLEVLNFQIARDGITRISVENDEIDDVYVYPFQFTDNVKLHKTGQVFVVTDHMDSHVHLTLITKRGLTQDLKISPTNKNPEPIILKPVNLSDQPKDDVDQANLILEKFIQGIQPSDFYPIDIEETSRSGGSISCIVEGAYQRSSFRVIVYSVKNETSDVVALDNRLFWGEGDLALAFDHLKIEPTQTAKLYVIQKI